MGDLEHFIELLDGDAPAGAEVHALPKSPDTLRDTASATIRVTRTDGSIWFCQTTPKVFVDCDPPPSTDVIAELPNGRSFSTGFYIVDRNSPQQFEHTPRYLQDIKWSQTRDLVFFFSCKEVLACGREGRLWRRHLPNAVSRGVLLFDWIADNGSFHCTARSDEYNEHGYPKANRYIIDRLGNVSISAEE